LIHGKARELEVVCVIVSGDVDLRVIGQGERRVVCCHRFQHEHLVAQGRYRYDGRCLASRDVGDNLSVGALEPHTLTLDLV